MMWEDARAQAVVILIQRENRLGVLVLWQLQHVAEQEPIWQSCNALPCLVRFILTGSHTFFRTIAETVELARVEATTESVVHSSIPRIAMAYSLTRTTLADSSSSTLAKKHYVVIP